MTIVKGVGAWFIPTLFIQETRSRLLLGCPHRYGAEVSDAPGFRDDSWTDPDVLRDGIIPLYFDHDIGGPMVRTVADAVAIFNVIAGHDPADPVTAGSVDHRSADYTEYLDLSALRGARIGVMRQWSNREGADAEVIARFEDALADLENRKLLRAAVRRQLALPLIPLRGRLAPLGRSR